VDARSADRRPRGLGLTQDGVDLLGRTDIVRERDAAPAAGVLDAAVRGELVAAPEADDDPAGLEEDDVVVRCRVRRPPERLVEGTRAGEVAHAEGDEADALLHQRWSTASRA
jgi:hypothetical protein